MTKLTAHLNLSDDVIADAHELRGALPLDDYLSFCTELGLLDLVDNATAQRRDFVYQQMNQAMAHQQRSRAKQARREPTELKVLPPPGEE